MLARPDTGLQSSCQKANLLENTRFVDAHKAEGVKYQHVLAYINLFNYCYANTYQLASLLAIGDQLMVHSAGQSAPLTPDHVIAVSRTVTTGIYGCALNSTDTRMFLQLLKHLIEIQIVTNENPRRMLRTGSCSFARFYHSLHESLFSSKMFLTAALNDAVMRVLIEDEMALELDHVKAAMSLPQGERQKRFGSEADPEYPNRVKQYVQDTTSVLYKFVAKFIRSLTNSWCLFPATLRWLVKTMCYELKRAKFDERCIYEMLTDMVLINFICPAIVSPEIYGITDCPISENARSNLITIGQVLQQMALLKYQSCDPKFQEMFDKFELNEVSELLTQLLLESATPEKGLPVNDIEQPMSGASGEVQRSHVLVAQTDLNMFVEYFRIVLSKDELNVSGECRRKLGDILGQLPHALENLLTSPGGSSTTTTALDKKTSLMSGLGKQTKQKLSKTLSLTTTQSFEEETVPKCDPALVLVIPVTINQAAVEILSEEEVMCRSTNGGATNSAINPGDDDENSEEHLVTVGDIIENGENVGEASDMADILSEQNVVELQRQQHGRGTENPEMIILKADRTKHFAMINDDVSIGNTSDNLEAVSEAHSNHSVASSLDLEENDQNDNLSDMVSANVSGRGSPNISGRDTPSSQVTEGNENHRPPVLPAAKMLNKARSDIDDKFCKFEIKKLPAGDETISIMSDTWSTDVLASDSETLDAGSDRDRQFSTPLIPANVILPGDNDFVATMGNGALSGVGRGSSVTGGANTRNAYDISETQSESAWSMDVLASDSEKLAEIDTDDNQSIAARSDITDASSAPDAASYRDGNNNGIVGNSSGIPDSPFFGPRSGSCGGTTNRRNSHNTPESPAASSSKHRNGESVFFGQRRSHGGEDHNQSTATMTGDREDSRFMAALRRSGTEMSRNSSFQSDSGANQLGGGSAMTNNNNPFLTPHRNQSSSSGSERNKKFYSARQQSSESNHSSTFDGDLKHESFDSWKESGARATGGQQHHKKGSKSGNKSHGEKEAANNSRAVKSHNPGTSSTAVVATGGGSHKNKREAIIRTNSTLTNPFAVEIPTTVSDDSVGVEHRATSMDQRNASFDGRRNGMMQITSSTVRQSTSSKSSTVVRNYENHEIIMRHNDKGMGSSTTTTSTKTSSSSTSVTYRENDPEMGDLLDLEAVTAGGQQQSLVEKTRALTLMPAATTNGDSPPYRNGVNLQNGTVTKTGKFTGAIPKSISFDATADKRHDQQHKHYHHHQQNNQNHHQSSSQNYSQDRHHHRQSHGHSRGLSQNSSFLNKIRQGLKNSTKKNSKNGAGGSGNSKVSDSPWDPFNDSNNGNNGRPAEGGAVNLIDIEDLEPVYQETSEDILAKYRRKVSTASSEANASDSTSGSRASSSFKSKHSSESDYRMSNNTDMVRLGAPVSSNDLFHFNNAKKKLRTVLSSADVHTLDFRYNSVGIQKRSGLAIRSFIEIIFHCRTPTQSSPCSST